MKKHFSLLVLSALLVFAARANANDATAPVSPPAGGDPFPNACVDCHQLLPDRGLDVRLSTLFAAWEEGAPSPRAQRAARAAAPDTVAGRHPELADGLGSIPHSCKTCHDDPQVGAPPLDQLMHLIHLEGGESNHFIVEFQGNCAFCHKLDAATGAMAVPSAEERPVP